MPLARATSLLLVLNVTYPLVPEPGRPISASGKRAVLMVLEEGQPEYIEQEIATLLAPP
jgi:indolepyruvate ferredoxin oxidoreductase alpha subunit